MSRPRITGMWKLVQPSQTRFHRARYPAVVVFVLLTVLLLFLAPTSPFWNVPVAKADAVQVVFEFSEVVKPEGDDRDLAVAFHSVNFLEADGDSIGTLLFGTPEANALQGEGWFGNEEWPDIGSFQWAGGSSKRASMQLPIPEGTEGLLFNITSIVDGLWMNVTVDGQLAATLRVDAYWYWGDQYWHSGYVPVGETPPAPTPGVEPEWVERRYFPQFPPPPDHIYAIWVRHELSHGGGGWSPDWRINASYETMMALTLVGMQGIINRNGPSLFLNWIPNPLWSTSRDPGFWIPILRRYVDIVYLELDSLSAVNFLLRRYGSLFEGAVIYDPTVPDTINLATMLAGLENRVILAPEQVGLPGIPSFKNVTDLRQLVQDQGWNATEEGKYQLYHWVYDNLWPRLEHRIIGVISPGPPTSRDPLHPEEEDWRLPLGMAARDYIVALRLTALWLSPSVEPQAGLFTQFLKEAPSPIPVLGFFGLDEEGTVAVASRFGDWVPVITIGNGPATPESLTVFSGVRSPLEQYRADIDIDSLFATLGERPAATIWCSDGDNIQFQINRGFGNFPWDEVQGYRFGWTINPTLPDLAPLVWNHYVESMSEVSLVSGLSGAGYMYPSLMNETQLRAYLEYTSRYLEDTGLRVMHVSNRFGPTFELGDDIAQLYYDNLRDTAFLGSFVGLSGFPWGIGFHYAGVPTPMVLPSYVTWTGANGMGIVKNLLARKPGEVFVDLAGAHTWYWDGDGYPWLFGGQVIEDADAYGSKAVHFSTEESTFVMVGGPFATLAPGNYNLTIRLKVSDNQETDPIAKVYVNPIEQPAIAAMYIAPSDFAVAGEYQTLTMSFTLDNVTTGIQFGLEYYGGSNPPPGSWASTDLFVDYILATRKEGLDLPVFAGIFQVTTYPGTPEALQLAEDLEMAGALVLSPDEFMAALNPEFMIEWASPILGPEHPALDEARQKLAEGDFLSSLLIIREALRTLPEHTYLLHFEEKGINYTVSIQGNTWITPLEYDETKHQIKFNTHGPPEGTVQAFVTIPNELQDGLSVVNIDDQSHPFTSSQNETHTTISLQFDQGPHIVEIPVPVLAPPTIANVSQTPAADNVLPEDEVKVNATVTDPNGVKQVILNYTYTNSTGTWTIVVNMTNLEGNIWNATIPAFPYGTNVTYRIIAEDNMNNTITTEDLGYEYQYSVIPEFLSLTTMLFILIVLTFSTAIYKRRSKPR